MIPNFTKVHNKFKFNKEYFNHQALKEVAYSFIKEGDKFEKEIGDFLLDWLDDNDYVHVMTSGSTGQPKIIKLQKQAMINSAIATGNFFKLEPGDRALHCLPSSFIAGKMMLVRAIILGLELDVISPSSNPLSGSARCYDFCAMVPMQVKNSIGELHKIKTLIIGGASISEVLDEKLQHAHANAYATYGMTETITHIAVKKLNHFNGQLPSGYRVLQDVSVSTDDRNCLVIDAPKLRTDAVVTNDVVKLLSETEFELIGRHDNIINSGGIKLFPEQIEAKLQGKIEQRFFIASKEDEVLGEAVILVAEGETNGIDEKIFETLEKFEIPKHIYYVEQFSETPTGKIQRSETLELLK